MQGRLLIGVLWLFGGIRGKASVLGSRSGGCFRGFMDFPVGRGHWLRGRDGFVFAVSAASWVGWCADIGAMVDIICIFILPQK